jgi:hypothetical protein
MTEVGLFPSSCEKQVSATRNLRTETNPASEALCFFVFSKIPEDGHSGEPQEPWVLCTIARTLGISLSFCVLSCPPHLPAISPFFPFIFPSCFFIIINEELLIKSEIRNDHLELVISLVLQPAQHRLKCLLWHKLRFSLKQPKFAFWVNDIAAVTMATCQRFLLCCVHYKIAWTRRRGNESEGSSCSCSFWAECDADVAISQASHSMDAAQRQPLISSFHYRSIPLRAFPLPIRPEPNERTCRLLFDFEIR